MKTTLPPLPVSEEVFRTIIRLHEQRRTYAEIGAVVGMSAQEVEDLRWKHLERWLKERQTIGKAVRTDFIMEVVGRLQVVMSATSNPKDLALLAKAIEGLLKHAPNDSPRPTRSSPPDLIPPTPFSEAEKGEQIEEKQHAHAAIDSPFSASEKGVGGMRSEAPVELTRAELVHLQALRDQSQTNTELLYKMQQAPTLYAKCMKIGVLPALERPAPPPAKRSWVFKLFTSVIAIAVTATLLVSSPRLRASLGESASTTNVQAHPPNH